VLRWSWQFRGTCVTRSRRRLGSSHAAFHRFAISQEAARMLQTSSSSAASIYSSDHSRCDTTRHCKTHERTRTRTDASATEGISPNALIGQLLLTYWTGRHAAGRTSDRESRAISRRRAAARAIAPAADRWRCLVRARSCDILDFKSDSEKRYFD